MKTEIKLIKKGKWIYDEKNDAYFCSECGEESLYNKSGCSDLSNYCPNCGKEMEGEE